MKLNSDFLIHDTGNGEMLIPVGEETKKFHGVVKLNGTGSEIVHLLEEEDLSINENTVSNIKMPKSFAVSNINRIFASC